MAQMKRERAEMFKDALKAARTSGKTKHITCAKCGADVVVSVKAVGAKYCPTCARNLVKAEQKAYRERMRRPVTGICTRCGVEFEYIYKGSERALCDDCKNAYNGRKRKESWHNSDEKMTRLFPEPTKKEIERELRQHRLDEIARAAQAAGMSYGKYKAMMAMKAAKKGARQK